MLKWYNFIPATIAGNRDNGSLDQLLYEGADRG